MFTCTTALTPLELKSAIALTPLVVSPDTTVMDAIALMSGMRSQCATTKTAESQLDELHLEIRSSCVLVAENERLLGILTERDIVRLSAQQQPLDRLVIRQVMAHPIVTLRESAFTDLFLTIDFLQQHNIRHLPILDERDRLLGLLTHESLRQTARPIDLLRLRMVADVMTSEVICAAPDRDLLTIAQLMANHCVSSVMIVEQGGSPTQPLTIPVGILTERDVVQFQALGLNLKSFTASAVMSTPIFTVKPEESLWKVQEIVAQRFISRIAVTGKQGELLGIVTQTSLLQASNPLELYKFAEVLEEKVEQLEAEKIKLLESRTIELERQVEARTADLNAKAQREKLVADLATQIRSSLSLQTILDTTVEKVRQVLGCDRVNIWQFEPDWQAIAVAESTDSPQSLVGERVNDTGFREHCIDIYTKGCARVIPDTYAIEMADCHRQLLIRLQTRAKILIPILCGDRLWGLLNATESQHARDWQPEEVELLQVLSVQLGIALQQATTHQQLHEELIARQQTEIRLRESQQQLQQLNQELEAKIAQRTQELWQVNSLQRAILNAADYSIISTDSTGIVQTFNAAAERMLGYSAAEVVGKVTLEIIHDLQETIDRATSLWMELGRDIPPGFEVFVAKARQGIVSEEEWTYIRKDGSRFPVLLSVSALKDANHQIIGFLGIGKDISDRKRAEAARQKTDLERQQLLQELSAFKLALDKSAIVAITDTKGVITYVNDRFSEISGYSREELIGKTHHLINSGYHPPAFFQEMWRTIASGEVWRSEICNRAKNASIYWVESTIVPFLDRRGRPFKYLSIRFDITARKLAETAIQEENAFRRQIVENMAEGLCVCHEIKEFPFVRFTVWNQQMLTITGYSLVEINRLGWYQSLYPNPKLQARAINRMKRMRQGKNIVAEEWQIQRKDDQQRTIAISTSILSSHDGLTYVLALIQDITERKQAEVALQESELRFRRVFDSSVVGMLFADFQGSIINANDYFLQMVGYTREELNAGAIRWDRMTPPEYAAADLNSISHLREHGFLKPWEKEYYCKDGTKVPILIGAAILPGTNNQTICVVMDIRDRKQAEQENQRLKERLQFVLSSNPAVIFTCNPDGNYGTTFISDNIRTVTGYTPEHFLTDASFWANHIHPEDAPKLFSELSQLFEEGHHSHEYRFLHQDGTYRWIRNELRLVRDRQGNPIEIVGYFADISDRKQYEIQLQQTNQELARATRLKDEFLANMSHELRTPLNAILGMTEGLQEKVFGDVNDRQIKALQTIERSGSHLLELINDILDVAKIESGQLQLERTPTAIANLCQSSLTFIKQQAQKKGIHLDIKLPLNLPDLLVDERRIRQVLINLLNNAVKFTPEGGRITLEVSRQKQAIAPEPPPVQGITRVRIYQTPLEQKLGLRAEEEGLKVTEYLRIAVIDTGIGIAAENINKLFQPFIQIDSALNRQYQGTGLGLALVKRIVELHGGRVGLTSKVGLGSCFTIDLPCTSSATSSIAPETQPQLSIVVSHLEQATSPLILLVEDNEANITTISSYLRAKGYQISLAKNGEEALSSVQSKQPDLILMDIQMPGMDGLEAIQQIRRNLKLVNVPIVALTALAMTGDRERCLAAGANDYLSKPVKLKQLVNIIQQLLSSQEYNP